MLHFEKIVFIKQKFDLWKILSQDCVKKPVLLELVKYFSYCENAAMY